MTQRLCEEGRSALGISCEYEVGRNSVIREAKMSFQQRNHYNPCFWTALWNVEFFEALRSGTEHPSQARKQTVSVASLAMMNWPL